MVCRVGVVMVVFVIEHSLYAYGPRRFDLRIRVIAYDHHVLGVLAAILHDLQENVFLGFVRFHRVDYMDS
jgi:hypothetical protein